MCTKQSFVATILLSIASLANAFDILIGEEHYSPSGACQVHPETPLSAPQINCFSDSIEVDFILNSSYKDLDWIKTRMPELIRQSKSTKTYIEVVKCKYVQATAAPNGSNEKHFSRFYLSEYLFLRVTSKSYEDLQKETTNFWPGDT